jgi:transposase
MKTKRDYQLCDEDQHIIQRAMRHDRRPEVRRKAQAIHLLHQGHPVTKVAKMVAVARQTVYTWHDGWLVGGIEGMVRREGSGRRYKASPTYERLLEAALATEPAELGYEFTVWTLDRLLQHLYKKTGIRISDRTMSNTLKRLGYVYRRPKRDLSHLQDPEVMARAMTQLEQLKKRHQPGPLSSSLWTKRR